MGRVHSGHATHAWRLPTQMPQVPGQEAVRPQVSRPPSLGSSCLSTRHPPVCPKRSCL